MPTNEERNPKLPTQLEKTAGAALARIQLDAGSLPLFFAVFTLPTEQKAMMHLVSLQAVAMFAKNCLFFRGHENRVIGVYPTSHDLHEHERLVNAIMKEHREFARAEAEIERCGSMKKIQ